MHIRGVVDDVGMGEKGYSAYISRKQNEKKPLYDVPFSYHRAGKDTVFYFF